MASTTAKTAAPEFVEGADPTESPEGWQWDTVAEGAAIKVIFEEIGDEFIGLKLGKKHIDREPSANGQDQSFDLWEFRGRDGDLYAINNSYALEEALEDVPDGMWCRIIYVRDVVTAKSKSNDKYNDMKSYKVDVRRN